MKKDTISNSSVGFLVVASIVVVALVFLGRGCAQKVTRSYGGSMAVTLPAGQKLVTVTWKGDSLWHLTRPMREGEVAEKYSFVEDSAFGVMQGKVEIQEVK